MANYKDRGPIRKYRPFWWALTNYGNPVSIHGTKKAAIEACESHTGHPWAESKGYMEVRKVRLVEVLSD